LNRWARRSRSPAPCKPVSKGEGKMANENLKGLKVGILIEDGFEQVER
jgi:hypothetical protein